MNIEQLKKKLGLSTENLAEFFDLNYGSFANSSAKKRYENALCSFYEVAKKAYKKENDNRAEELIQQNQASLLTEEMDLFKSYANIIRAELRDEGLSSEDIKAVLLKTLDDHLS